MQTHKQKSIALSICSILALGRLCRMDLDKQRIHITKVLCGFVLCFPLWIESKPLNMAHEINFDNFFLICLAYASVKITCPIL